MRTELNTITGIFTMNVWRGNPADLLTSWAKTTASVSVRKKAGIVEVAWHLRGLVWGQSITPFYLPRQSTDTFHKIPPAHPRDSSGLCRSLTVVGKVAIEAVENCPSLTLLPFFCSAPIYLVYYSYSTGTVGNRLGLSLNPFPTIT
jgi:hypothetical protein